MPPALHVDNAKSVRASILNRAQIQEREIMSEDEMEDIIDLLLTWDHSRGECHLAFRASH